MDMMISGIMTMNFSHTSTDLKKDTKMITMTTSCGPVGMYKARVRSAVSMCVSTMAIPIPLLSLVA